MALAKVSAFHLLVAFFAFVGAGILAVVGRLTGRLSSFSSPSRTVRRIASSSSDSFARALVRGGDGGAERLLQPWENYYDPLTIAPGELPGYTGWARPERTLAGYFRIVSISPPPSGPIKTGNEWTVRVRCSAPECSAGGSHFYLRAYGPAIITGLVVDEGDGSYRATFYPVDPGRYTVEVVLAFSYAPPFDSFPLVGEEEPGYEGYLLPGFPLRMDVAVAAGAAEAGASSVARTLGGPTQGSADEWCSSAQLVETEGSGAALRSGRWKVVDRMQSGEHVLSSSSSSNPDGVSWEGYRENLNSLGVVLQYVPNDCRLLPESKMISPLTPGGEGSGGSEHLWDQCLSDAGIANSTDNADHIHIIMIGDSVMRLQEDALRGFLNNSTSTNVQITRIGMTGGISRTLTNVSSALDDIYDENPDGRRLVVFNSALHDTDRLCSSEMHGSRKKHFPGMNETDLVCVDFYRDLLGKFVDLIADYPAELKIFRTANAAWPKYGNYGFTWPTTRLQAFSRSPNFVAKINDIAYSVISEKGRGEISIVDGYWMTLPRPDHTEVGKVNTIGKHMVHPGVHVSSAMTMKVFMLALRRICSATLDDWL